MGLKVRANIVKCIRSVGRSVGRSPAFFGGYAESIGAVHAEAIGVRGGK